MAPRKFVIVKFQIEGTHFWDTCNIAEVNYLAAEHRHVFHITAKKEVSHDDREIEIIRLKHDLQKYMEIYYCRDKRLHRLGATSCETLASILLKEFQLDYCEVLEDGENGAEVWA